MIGEIDLSGVLVAPLLLWMLLAWLITAALCRVLAWTGFYRLVWHSALFNLALYVVLLGGMVALVCSGIAP